MLGVNVKVVYPWFGFFSKQEIITFDFLPYGTPLSSAVTF